MGAASEEFHPIRERILVIFVLHIYPNLEGFNVWHLGKCMSKFQSRKEGFGEEEMTSSGPPKKEYFSANERVASLKVLLETVVFPPSNTSWPGAMRRHGVALEL